MAPDRKKDETFEKKIERKTGEAGLTQRIEGKNSKEAESAVTIVSSPGLGDWLGLQGGGKLQKKSGKILQPLVKAV